MARDNFNEAREAKAERYAELAEKNRKQGDQLIKNAVDMVSVIPMGQPILVGHHSERAHRNLLKRSDNAMHRGIEASDKADYYAEKAERMSKEPNAISSDDPEAIAKLKSKIANLEKSRELMKACNKIIKDKKDSDEVKREKLLKAGLSESNVNALMNPSKGWWGAGFAPFELTNSLANLKRLKDRLKTLEADEQAETSERQVLDLKIVDNIEVNRLQIFFDGKPEDEVRTALKSRGFRWSGRLGCWQCYRTANGRYSLKYFIAWYKEHKSFDNQ